MTAVATTVRRGSHTETIMDYLRSFPNSTSKQIADATDIPLNTISARLTYARSVGLVLGQEVGRSVTNRPIMGYTLAVQTIPRQNKGNRAPKPAPAAKEQPPYVFGGFDALIEQFSTQLAEQVALKVREKLEHTMSSVMALPAPNIDRSAAVRALTESNAAGVDIPTTVLPKVGVVGLLPIQAGEISKEFHDCMDLHFWNDGDGRSKLTSIGSNCEVVFLHTRHAAHVTDQMLKNAGAKIYRVGGGTSALKAAMTEYFVGRN